MAAWESLLEELIASRRSALVGYAYVLTGNLGEAEDLVHDAVLRTFSRPRALGDVRHAEGYMRKAIATTFLNGKRKHRNFLAKVHLMADAPAAPDTAETVSEVDAVRAAMQRLTPRERACVVLRYFEQMRVREVADTLGIAEGSVKRYLSDAVAQLTRELGPLPGLDGDEPPERRVVTVGGRPAWRAR